MSWLQPIKDFINKRPRLSRAAHTITRGWAIRTRVRLSGVPVIAITGTNGKTTIALVLNNLLRQVGYKVGLSSTYGVQKNGQWLSRDDLAGMGGVSMSAKGGGVDVLVAETARGGIIRFGFAFSKCDVAVVTNVSEDHLGMDGVSTIDEMAEVKSRLLNRLAPAGTAVLNADDPRVTNMAAKVRGNIIWFSMRGRPTHAEHCIFVRDAHIYRYCNGRTKRLIAASDVAIGRSGLLQYNICNALAIIAAIDAIGDKIRVSDRNLLRHLKQTDVDSSGWLVSFQLIDYDSSHVLLCHSKNPRGFELDTQCLSQLRLTNGYTHVVGLFTSPGNRRPEFHKLIIDIASNACDKLMAVPPRDAFLRGKTRASLVAVLESHIAPTKKLVSMDAPCGTIIERIRSEFPSTTLFVVFNARIQRGADELVKSGRVLDTS